MALQLTIACGDYDRTHPLIDGSIKPEPDIMSGNPWPTRVTPTWAAPVSRGP